MELILSGSLLQELEEGISSHQPSFAALNRTGDGIIQKLSLTDGSFLKDKLAGLNQRWGAIAAEVKDRRPRWLSRDNSRAQGEGIWAEPWDTRWWVPSSFYHLMLGGGYGYSSILTWRIPWTEDPGGLQSLGLQRVRHDWVTNAFTFCSHVTRVLLMFKTSTVHVLYFCVFLRLKGHPLSNFSTQICQKNLHSSFFLTVYYDTDFATGIWSRWRSTLDSGWRRGFQGKLLPPSLPDRVSGSWRGICLTEEFLVSKGALCLYTSVLCT